VASPSDQKCTEKAAASLPGPIRQLGTNMTNPVPLILSIDDDRLLQLAEIRLLKQAGYRTCQANDGLTGLQMAREQKPDLTLLDVNLPDMSGVEVCRLIKADPALAGCFVVMLSGEFIDAQSRVNGLESGADGYIPRPVTQTELLARVRGILRIHQAEAALRESEARHKSMIANISDVIAIMASDGTLKYQSPNLKKWFGWEAEDRVGASAWETVHPEDLEWVQKEFLALLKQDNAVKTLEYRFRCQDESYKVIELTAVNLTHDPTINGVLMNYHDITARKETEAQLQQLSSAVEHSPASICITDIEGKIEYVNPKFSASTGYSLEEVRGKTPSILKSSQTPTTVYVELWQTIQAGKEWRGEFLNRKKNGAFYWEYASISAITNAQGKITHFVAVNEDVTERKAAEENIRLLNADLEQLASTDYLTNLSNRRYFAQRGAEELKQARQNNQPLALIMLDIDRFKNVNDTCGHEAGDLALQQVAAALKASLREIDLLGRLGGDEFSVLLPNTSLENASLLAERIRKAIEQIPLEISGKSLVITVSGGVAAFTDQMSGIDDLLRNADVALYSAKNSGRNCIRPHSACCTAAPTCCCRLAVAARR